MPSLKQIRRRISSVKNTQQITRAMKMVAAAKLRRAQENMFQARPYSDQLRTVIRDLAARTDKESHPLLQVREPKHVGMVVVTSDRGLAGGFNNNVCKAAQKVINQEKEHAEDVRLIAIGRRGYDFFRKRDGEFIQHHIGLLNDLNFGTAVSIGSAVRKLYEVGFTEESGLDRVYLIYNEFKSAIEQRVVTEQLFPIILNWQGKNSIQLILSMNPANALF